MAVVSASLVECPSDIHVSVLFRRATVEEIISRINVSSSTSSSKICELYCCVAVSLLDFVSCSYAVIGVWHFHKVVVSK